MGDAPNISCKFSLSFLVACLGVFKTVFLQLRNLFLAVDWSCPLNILQVFCSRLGIPFSFGLCCLTCPDGLLLVAPVAFHSVLCMRLGLYSVQESGFHMFPCNLNDVWTSLGCSLSISATEQPTLLGNYWIHSHHNLWMGAPTVVNHKSLGLKLLRSQQG